MIEKNRTLCVGGGLEPSISISMKAHYQGEINLLSALRGTKMMSAHKGETR